MTTYRDLKETDDGDLAIVNGDFVIIEDEDVVIQNLKSNYRLSKNDWFLNLNEGLRFFDNENGIIGNNSISEENRADLITTGKNSVGVNELTSIAFNLEDGVLTVPITVVTEFATETLEITI